MVAAAALLTKEVLAGRIKLEAWDETVEQWIVRVNRLAEWFPELEVNPLTDADRAVILRHSVDAAERRIVVTHGTDTMTETARALAEGLATNASLTRKLLATLAPFSDEIFVPPYRPVRGKEEEKYALGFSIPTATKGLSFICRQRSILRRSERER